MIPIPIKPLGRFFENDENGFVINPCSLDLIPEKYIPIIEIIKTHYLKNYPDEIHSIYLRGSLPRGLAVDKISDLDSFTLVQKTNIRWEKATGTEELNVKIKEDFPFVGEIEMMLSSFNKTLFSVNPRLSMILKTGALCIFGPDVIPSLPKFKPGRQMMLNYTWIEDDVNEFLNNKNIQKADCQEIMKILIRTGFELAMESVQKYTPDLYLCYHTFSEFYPFRQKDMKQALHLYLNPSEDVSFLKPFVRNLGLWMTEEVRKQIG